MNGTLYPFGARLQDGCTVYECQKRDNCGKFVPVEWGKFCTRTEVYNIKTSVSIFCSKSDLPKKVFFSIQFSSKHLFRLLKLSNELFIICYKVVTGWIGVMDQETNGSQIEAVLFSPAKCTRNQMEMSTW